MRISLLILSISFACLSLFAQYDEGTIIYSETNTNAIQKNYKVVDFNGDNFADILFIKDRNTNQLTWFKGDESSNFSEQENLLEVDDNHKENEIFYTDMNGDGIEDIVFQNSNTAFTTLLNDGQGNISNQIENELANDEFVGADLKELADLDGDGDKDGIFFAKTDSMSFWEQLLGHSIIYYNDGTGMLSNFSYLDKEDYSIYYQVETGDFDGDGDADIVCNGERFFYDPDLISIGYVRYFFPFIRVYKNTGPNSYAPKQEIDLPGRTYFVNIKLQDLNSDGYDELLVEKSFSNINNCEDDTHSTGCETIKEFEILKYDVQNETFVSLELYNFWLHNYTFNEETPYAIELQKEAFHLQYAHQNTDNNLDILSVNVPQKKLQWYLGDGNANFNNTETVNLNDKYSNTQPTLRVADIDNDADLDIFVLLNDSISSTLTLFKNETPVSINSQNFVFGKMGITPNPIQGNAHLKLNIPQNQNLSDGTYNLYTIDGVKLTSNNINNGRIFIPDLPTGMYIIDINLKEKKYIEKIIIN